VCHGAIAKKGELWAFEILAIYAGRIRKIRSKELENFPRWHTGPSCCSKGAASMVGLLSVRPDS
jgi:hypothetical protein